MRSLSFLVCALLSAASAWHAAPVHRQAPLSNRCTVRAAPAMSEPLVLATQLAATPISGAELPLPSVLLGEGVFDLIEAGADGAEVGVLEETDHVSFGGLL